MNEGREIPAVSPARNPARRLARSGQMVCALLGCVTLTVALLWGADRLFPPDMSRARAFALLMQDRRGEVMDGRVSGDGAWRFATPAASVDPHYRAMLLAIEDRRFWLHPGIDPLSLLRAGYQLTTRGHIVSGGSTLAMQTARLLSPHRHSWRGKIQDMARALQLEWRYGHRGVLDLYLTLAPESRNIEGIRAASLLWFGHEPLHLSDEEAALLIMMARHPEALRPDRHPQAAHRAVAALLAGHPSLRTAGEATPFALIPAGIVHEAQGALTWQWRQGTRNVYQASLDRRIQSNLARILRQTPPPEGGTWAVLVAQRDGGIAAWQGNAGNGCSGCAADMITSWRSPGSTLKPAIYALAFQLGYLAPDTLIQDRATRFGGYAPRNYDRVFHGTTTIRNALQRSYNLPAVRALDMIGASYFAGTLDAAGIRLKLPPATPPSLALALGGVGITPLDLARLYGIFANHGMSRPVGLDWPVAPSEGMRMIGGHAAHQIMSILRGTPLPKGRIDTQDQRMAFKTGTSYGQRDAWAVGVRGDWIVVVWGGRPDGTAVPGITGLGTSAPLLMNVFDILPPEGDEGPDAMAPAASLSPALVRARDNAGPRIVQPGNGGVVECFAEDGQVTPLGLVASGGTEPYRWLVNGVPLDTPVGITPSWKPDSPGFVHIALVDATGAGSAVDIRIR
ncbi:MULTISPECIES: transglycosylase domain-containing protein [Asaia]|uniref:transglycosylase domain-containing protein n=1 Tax=Asaia TaxID=91914 RepID=UPI002552A29A|nr:transglycosylase domain-containing protein [Asaia sp. HumB]MDL2170097.1 transglycosylase domain-containing protein [Asaia sp. HumB]